ncbi:multidrug resistance protein 1, 2, 3 [Talaromyces proteolyticus]|uniref:ABC multidrug transporter MDR2 n=1 Tax=Talaromyces proteolyticus TaxID=1131652 RepID=A0AAD4KKD9_9EURO|nr:multidrug resistance protein 1, 2, 3 [Talaromyces proteolyticus]KAH8693553.1 multidrug resistance protein 1, 2, 3 [Talaromyces proteolyticus]
MSKIKDAEGLQMEPRAEATSSAHQTLSENQIDILTQQIDVPKVTVSYFQIYKYAGKWDIVIFVMSAICAMLGGAALPLFTVFFGQVTSSLKEVAIGSITYDHFYHELTKNVLYFTYLGIAEFILSFFSTLGLVYTGNTITQKIRVRYFQAILQQNIAFFDVLGTGEITTRITGDMHLIQDGISEKLSLVLSGVSSFVTAFIIAYIKYWKLALVSTSTLVALLIIMGSGSVVSVIYGKRSIERYGHGGNLADNAFESIRTVVAFGAQESLAEKYDGYMREGERFGRVLQISFALVIGALLGIMYLNYGLGFWMGSRFLVEQNSDLAPGDILTIMMAIILGSYSLGNVAPNLQAFSDAVAAASKIFSVIDRVSPLNPWSAEGTAVRTLNGEIQFHDIKHVYPSRQEVLVLDSFNIHIPAGKTTAFVGPSGSGKSTIIGLIERFYTPIEGEITIDGHDIRTLNLHSLRRQISLVSQEPQLFSATIFENIRYGLTGSEFESEPKNKIQQRVVYAAQLANAHDFIMALPDGYETHIGSLSLSGGQKQRISIARAVVKEPKILLLDEATSALDTKSEAHVQLALEKAAEGRTTIIIAHRLSTIKNAHNIVVLVDGKIAEQGTHKDLIDHGGAYFNLVQAQSLNEDKTEKDELGIDEDGLDFFSISDGDTHNHGPFDSDIQLHKSALNERSTTRFRPESKLLSGATYPSVYSLVKFIAGFNRPERQIMAIGLILSICAGAVQPSQAVLMAKAVSTITLPASEFQKLRHDTNFWCLMFLMMGLATFLLYALQGILFAISSEKLIRRARTTTFRVLLNQDISFYDEEEHATGALTSILATDTKSLSGISGATLGTLLVMIVNLLGALIVALILGWKLALVCISAVPVLILSGFLRIWVLNKLQSKSKKVYQSSANFASEAASAIRTVASFTMESAMLKSYSTRLEQQTKDNIPSIVKSSFLYASSEAVQFFCMALGFWYGGTLVGHHEYTIFKFYVCFSEVIFGAQAAGRIFSYAPGISKAKNAAEELKSLYDRKPRIGSQNNGDTLPRVEGRIEFQNVHFRYPSRIEHLVLQGLNLTILPGQYVALVGASGCGKSTCIALLERFYDSRLGEIRVDGRDITQLDVRSYRKQLAFVGQEAALFEGTIRENILLGCNPMEVSEDSLIAACQDANIYNFIISLPQGFDTEVGNKGRMLSGGQKQRIAIARALMRDPRILLLDEATSALDSESEKLVQAALDTAARGRTTIAVAHRLSTIQRADIIYVLDNGRVAESGSHAELLRKKGRYFELVNLQNLG